MRSEVVIFEVRNEELAKFFQSLLVSECLFFNKLTYKGYPLCSTTIYLHSLNKIVDELTVNLTV